MRTTIIVLIIILSSPYVFTQSIEQLYIAPKVHSYNFYSPNEPQYQYINQIYEQIKLVFPAEKKFPTLEVYHYFKEGNSRIACIEEERLVIDYNVVDTCLRVFNNREKVTSIVSYIIGHELSHYIHREKDKNFSCSLFTNDTLSKAKKGSLYKIELERDKEGHFYARVAGFRPNQAIDKFFMEIYPHFVTDNSYYPSNQTRLDEIKSTYQEADRLYHIFEAAHYLSILGYYHEAATAYEYLIQHFPSREMYYNAVCVNLTLFGSNKIFTFNKYEMALLFEKNSSLRGKHTLEDEVILEYFNKTNLYLEKLNALSPNYKLTPVVNLYYQLFNDIHNKKFDYLYHIEQANTVLNKYTTQDSLIKGTIENFIGIVCGLAKQKAEAISHFEKAMQYGIKIAEYNILVVNEKPIDGNKPTKLALDFFYKDKMKDMNIFKVIMDTIDINIKTYYIDSIDTQITIIKHNQGKTLTLEKHIKAITKEGITLYTNRIDIENKYGTNYTEYISTTERIMIYSSNGLAFVLNKENKLIYWIHYRA